MANNNAVKTGVILMTYGSATTAENVSDYLNHVYKKGVPEGLIEDFEERYRLVGSSPLVEITNKQAALLEANLNAVEDGAYIVRAGMLHSDPFIDEAVLKCKKNGAEKIVGVILSPQFSSFIMEGYKGALMHAAENHGYSDNAVSVAAPWPTEGNFISLLASRVEESMRKLKDKHGADVPVVFTTHSLPQRVVEKDPSYLDQLQETSDAVLSKLDQPSLEWYTGYQSAGHTPEEWLKPDLVDILADLRVKKAPAVLIVPIQFLADHLEILYDLDIAAGEQCSEYGIEYNRIELPNVDNRFIRALAEVVEATE